jgi:hypothetical protein
MDAKQIQQIKQFLDHRQGKQQQQRSNNGASTNGDRFYEFLS